jgi:tetratricopeptide (TPR) repeat protein
MLAVLAAGSVSAETSAAATNAAKPSPEQIEKAYRALLEEDDTAQADVDAWILENNSFKAKGAGAPDSELNARIQGRFDKVKAAYDRFIAANPSHVRARLAYGSLLSDLQDELGARVQWERAYELDPKNPAVLNNLAGAYSESGQPEKSFEFYTKAIELKPSEALYYHNFANSLWVLRRTATSYYKLNEQQVFAKCLNLFSNAFQLAPSNFPYASDFAQSFYAIKPFPADPALKAWSNALAIAPNGLEREGVYIHLARVKMLAGKYPEARQHLQSVTDQKYDQLKTKLLQSIDEREHPEPSTNSPAVNAAPVKP